MNLTDLFRRPRRNPWDASAWDELRTSPTVSHVLAGLLDSMGGSWQQDLDLDMVEVLRSAGTEDAELRRVQFLRETLAEAGRTIWEKQKQLIRHLDDFTRYYLETALWSSTPAYTDDENDDRSYRDRGYEITSILPETLRESIKDCDAFQEEFGRAIDAAPAAYRNESNRAMAGFHFWLTRNGHGAGFNDGQWPEDLGDAMAESACAYGEADIEVDPDPEPFYAALRDDPSSADLQREVGRLGGELAAQFGGLDLLRTLVAEMLSIEDAP